MKTFLRLSACLILLSFLTAAALRAQQDKPSPPAQPKYTEIKYSADKSSYRWEGEDRILVLTGSVKFVQGDTILTADKVDYREATKTALATGNLKIQDKQSTITGEKCLVNFQEKKVRVTGSVVMAAKPEKKEQKEGEKPQWKDEVTVKCSDVEYFYKDKKANVPVPVTILQKNRIVTADTATWDGICVESSTWSATSRARTTRNATHSTPPEWYSPSRTTTSGWKPKKRPAHSM